MLRAAARLSKAILPDQLFEDSKALMLESLVVSDRMRAKMRRDGASPPVMMNARTFLHVTTKDDQHQDEIKGAASSLHDYNEMAKTREGYPYLSVLMDKSGSARIIGHDGRHRIAAAINAGHDHVPVALMISDHEYRPVKNYKGKLPKLIAGQHRGNVNTSTDFLTDK
jgi:hypothetical protein